MMREDITRKLLNTYIITFSVAYTPTLVVAAASPGRVVWLRVYVSFEVVMSLRTYLFQTCWRDQHQ